MDDLKSNDQLIRELAGSERVFSLLVQSVTDYAIFLLDTRGNVVTWNEGARKIYGYTADEVLGKQVSIFYSQESKDAKHPQLELEQALKEGRHEDEGWRIRKDSSPFWANVVITPVYDQDTLIGFANITCDLTVRKESEANKSVFKLLVDGVKDYAIFMLNPDGIIKTWNEGAEHIKGYKADEIIGKHFSIFYTPDAVQSKHPQNELEIAKEKGSYEEQGWRVRKDGTLLWVNVVITAIKENGKLIGFAKVTRDLTNSRKAERDEELFQLLVGSVSDYAIFMLDPQGKVLTWNEGAQRIKGYKADEIIGKHFSIFYTKDTRARNHPQQELELAVKDGRYEEEGWRVRKDGSLLWASVVITAIHQDDKLVGFAKVTRDLTQRLLADQERQMNSKILDDTNTALRSALEIKSRFLSTVSHEVRTPMSGIIGMTELLTMQDLGEDNNEIAKGIFDSSKRLLQLLNNLLDSAKMESGVMNIAHAPIPISSVIGDIRQLIMPDALKKKLKVIGSFDSNIPQTVYGDEQKLRQILLNLAFNAVKFTNAGEVTISADLLKTGTSKITIRFSVNDTGIGIKAEDGVKLFQPFVQAEDSTKTLYGGTGLGLSICRQLAELIGGHIDFTSRHGHGSTFWCDIPFSLGAEKGD